MAWDGDDLAGKAEEAAERAQAAAEDRRARRQKEASAEQGKVNGAELESLRLSHARTVDQLSRATNPAHRAMLERALQSLEEKLAANN